ncbi:putative transcription factor C2H2 family [Helianthus annuus]|nr:putative transcription factor C2H2 family [Helianthus annuus]
MSDEGEKTCPLCAEEMDLTDQQLRPCKCGYDICVWCWHHIMDMAEKDDTEGRCPACRTPYNKEKIVGTASKCERLVAEMSVEKKQKSQKGKTKASEGRKHLSSVRVIQRNLVYIVGLPLNLADEELLQRKEYFGQYGKVLKVSISRTAAGTIQHFANNTCSVYITYSKEDEAVRSIQSVHGFVLEGRPLKACFGTTKYCHAWLRSMPCTNPDCLYLHEFGSQEDSFTKDEIISEYTRGRVQQVTGATNELQRRSGNILPPAADDYSNNSTSSWGKPVSKTTTNDSVNSKGSPPNSSSGRSLALPAAASWGTRASNSQPFAANIASPNGPSKQKVETYTTQSSSTAAAVSPSSHNNEILKKHIDENPTSETKRKLEHSESVQHATATDHRETLSEIPVEDDDVDVSDEEGIHQLSSDLSAISIVTNDESSHTHNEETLKEPFDDNNNNNNNDNVIGERSWNKVQEAVINEVEADLLSFNNQRLSDPEVVTHNTHTYTGYVQNTPQSSHLNPNIPIANGDSYFHATDTVTDVSNGDHRTALDLGENSIISNILSMDFDPWDESLTSPQNLAKLLGNSDKQQQASSQRVSSSRKMQNVNQSRFSFAREDDESIDQRSNFNFQNFSTDAYPRQHTDSNGFSSFNFEESDRTAGGYPSLSPNKFSASRSQISAPPGFMGPSRAPPPGFASNERIEQTYDNLSGNNHMFDSSFLLRKVNQAPGAVYNDGSISELEFMDPAILAVGGRVPSGVTSPGLDMRSNYPTQHTSYETDSNRLRLLMQRSFTQQNLRFNELGGDNNNLSYPQRTDSYGVSSRIIDQTLLNNNHRSHYQQQQVGNLTSFQQARMTTSSNGHWGDGWNEVQNGNDIAMAEILRNERLGGFNKYYSGYEDTKYRVPSSGDLYNRTFGI